MSGDIGPDKGSAVEPDNDKSIEQGEADGRHNEQIHCGDMRGMIAQKGAPSLAWRPSAPDHVLWMARPY
jgi:hypothetical protein